MTEEFTTYADGASGRVALTRHSSLDEAVQHAEALAGEHGIRYQKIVANTAKERHARANAARIVVVSPSGEDVFTVHMRYR